MRVILVGQAPSRPGAREAFECGSASAAMLERLLLFQPGELLRRVDAVNLALDFPGRVGPGVSGDRVPSRDQRRADEVAAFASTYDRVIACGAFVARSLGMSDLDPILEWLPWRGTLACRLPHPSGANRWWNAPENRRSATRFLREVVPPRYAWEMP